ncbi:MAG TPA: YopX family protein [Pyrinomonadaceae bacterium]|jgi:uncharacterized phage protein (TIGR01671 family)|nr:YopX family protein [Pyrinomonadaceae bacterium]
MNNPRINQRELKFRGWHSKLQRIIPASELVEDQLTITADGRFINVSGSSAVLSVIFPPDKFVPMQYTGLKDKNGVEIYEGDIVRYQFRGPQGEIRNDYVGIVQWDEVNPCFMVQDAKDPNRYDYDFVVCGMVAIEVLGNVHEDAHLLEVPA